MDDFTKEMMWIKTIIEELDFLVTYPTLTVIIYNYLYLLCDPFAFPILVTSLSCYNQAFSAVYNFIFFIVNHDSVMYAYEMTF